MRALALKCGAQTTVDTCDAAWTTGDIGATVSTQSSAGNFLQGSASNLIAIPGAAGTGRIAYHATGTLNLSAYMGVQLWLFNSAILSQGQFSLVLYSNSNGTGVLDTIPMPGDLLVSRWNAVFFPFTNPSTLTAVQSVGLVNNVVYPYLNAFLLDCLYAVNAVNLPILWVRGFDDVDDLRTHPGIDITDLQGTRSQIINSQAREIAVQTASWSSKPGRVWVASTFNMASDKRILYSGEELPVVWKSGQNPFKSAWEGNTELARKYLFEFDEKTTWSSSIPLSLTQA